MFNIEKFDIKLDTEFIGRCFIYCEEIESTNSFLLNSKDYKENGTVVLAEFQNKGRGRKNREWVSNPEQNLTFSILLNDKIKANRLNIINLGASLAVAHSLENLFQLKVNLKWPNDVLIKNKKISGILLETISIGNNIDRVIVGIGINVNQPNFPGKYLIPPTSVKREFKDKVSRERLLSEVLNNFELIYNICLNDPFKILNDWKVRCNMLGEKIQVEDDSGTRYGVFEDINNEGHLMLKTGTKTEKIHFGDVSLRQ
ncbi:MAG: biotin--[acetyl-CoA-carboxylase] ligase [Ignavibacteria bacterium RBG_13_36_8]|nr:MAG: biotin--[acetyl-CoA-carboxylase] ligase [Ignavibacteria bacterium RBG_13_36_8]